MRRILVAGNWKMNGSKDMVETLLGGLLAQADDGGAVDMAVFPPFPYLGQVQKLLDGSSSAWGAQNLNPLPGGAHTGEVAEQFSRVEHLENLNQSLEAA